MERRARLIGGLTLIVVVLGIVLGVALIRSSTSDRTEGTLVSVGLRLPIPAVDMAFAPYYVGVDKGIFNKHGIDVRLEPGGSELNPVTMVSQGKDLFGVVGGPELVLSGRSKGAKIKAISLLHHNSNFVVIITLTKSGIKTLEQLHGKRVGFFYGHISTDILHMLFRKADINVTEVDIGFDYGPLIAEHIDAAWGFRTTGGVNLPARGVDITMINPANYGITTHGHVVIANEAAIEEQPELVQRFTDALVESINYYLTHPEEAVAAARQRDPNIPDAILKEQDRLYRETILANTRVGWIDASVMQGAKQQMVAAGILPDSVDAQAAVTSRFVQRSHDAGK